MHNKNHCYLARILARLINYNQDTCSPKALLHCQKGPLDSTLLVYGPDHYYSTCLLATMDYFLLSLFVQ